MMTRSDKVVLIISVLFTVIVIGGILARASHDFQTAFWPNFWSTLLGALIGIPSALYLNRVFQNQSKQEESCAKSEQIKEIYSIITSSIKNNHKLLGVLIDSIRPNGLKPYDLPLDTTTWDALKDELLMHRSDPQLKQKIAIYFSRTEALQLYYRKTTVPNPVVPASASFVFGGSEQYVKNQSEMLIDEGDTIVTLINGVLKDI